MMKCKLGKTMFENYCTFNEGCDIEKNVYKKNLVRGINANDAYQKSIYYLYHKFNALLTKVYNKL